MTEQWERSRRLSCGLLWILMALPSLAPVLAQESPVKTSDGGSLHSREVSFAASDGETVHGTWFLADEPVRAVILAFHQGGASGVAEYAPIAPRLVRRGYHVLAIDQRAGGDLFAGRNRTVREHGGETGYCQAAPDLEGAVAHARKNHPGAPIVLWGSSYSGTLALRLAATDPEGVVGVLAFSPATGEPMAGCRSEQVSHAIGVPVLALRPRSELERSSSAAQFERFREDGHETFVADPGKHGASMLVEPRVGADVEPTWDVVLEFLERVVDRPTGLAPEDRRARPSMDLPALRETANLPALSVAVDVPGEPLWSEAVGLADLEDGVPVREEHAFHLASVTKLFTAVAVLRLVDAGRLSLDDTLATLVSDPTVRSLSHAGTITVGHLLDHTSGLYPTNNDPVYIEALIGTRQGEHAEWTPLDFVDRAVAEGPVAAPGSVTRYGDTNYVLLGLIVEAVTGERLADHVRRTIFDPLGMESAYYLSEVELDEQPPVPTAEGYVLLTDELRLLEWSDRLPEVRPGLLEATRAAERIDAAAGIVASAPDLARFGRAVFEGELLSDSSRASLLAPVAALEESDVGAQKQGIISAHRLRGGPVAAVQGDGPGGQHTVLAYDPESGAVVAALTNLFGPDGIHKLLLERVAGRVFRSKEPR